MAQKILAFDHYSVDTLKFNTMHDREGDLADQPEPAGSGNESREASGTNGTSPSLPLSSRVTGKVPPRLRGTPEQEAHREALSAWWKTFRGTPEYYAQIEREMREMAERRAALAELRKTSSSSQPTTPDREKTHVLAQEPTRDEIVRALKDQRDGKPIKPEMQALLLEAEASWNVMQKAKEDGVEVGPDTYKALVAYEVQRLQARRRTPMQPSQTPLTPERKAQQEAFNARVEQKRKANALRKGPLPDKLVSVDRFPLPTKPE